MAFIRKHIRLHLCLFAGLAVLALHDSRFTSLADATIIDERLALPDDVETIRDGRLPVQALFAAYQELIERGWELEVITLSRPAGTKIPLPVIALRSPRHGSATWILTGIHGEEPAGPNAVAAAIDDIAALGEHYPVVLLPLLNPHGYVRNWRYLNVPVYSADVDGQSVGDSSHLLADPDQPARARAEVSSVEADAITRYILRMKEAYPPRYSIDLHEDNLISEGYVYSQGELGADDPLASEAVRILRDSEIGIKMSGQTRFEEDVVAGIVGPVQDSSIDELMSSAEVVIDGHTEAGPGAQTVLVFETPAANLPLQQRVAAHRALLEQLAGKIAADVAHASDDHQGQ
jgi:hypothetical protein